MADGVGEDAPAVPVRADGVLLQGGAEGQDAALLGVDVVDFEVQVELLGVLAVGPLRGAVVLDPDEASSISPNWIPAQLSVPPCLTGRPVTSE